MRFSLLYVPSHIIGSPQIMYESILRQVSDADQQGWEGVWISEHHAHVYGGIFPSNLLFCAALSQRTYQIRIGTGVVVLPLNSPIHLAEQIAMLDQLSGGRIDIGIGTGFLFYEYETLNVEYHERMSRFFEAHDILITAWEQETFSFKGQHWQYPVSAILPRPMQSPHMPIWVAAARHPDIYKFAGEHGYHLMINPYTRQPSEIQQGILWYRESLIKHGFDPSTRRILANQHLYVGENVEQSSLQPRQYLLNYLNVATDAAMHSAIRLKSVQGEDFTSAVKPYTYEYMYPERVMFGTSEQICEKIMYYKALGITDLCFMAHFGDMPWSLSNESLQRFNEGVLPYFGDKA